MAYKLLSMAFFRWLGIVTVTAVVAAGCRGEKRAARPDSVLTESGSSAALPPEDTNHAWNPDAGQLLAVAMDSGSPDVGVVGPTGAVPTSVPLDLFGRSGFMGTSVIATRVSSGAGDCTAWPLARMNGGGKAGWSVGVQSGRAAPILLDSLEGMSSADSALFVTTVTRLAAAIPATHDSVFSSIPFVVQRAYRFRTDAIDGLVALVQRNIPSEADPRSDYTLFIAERPVGAREPYQTAYVERTAGRDDQTVVVSVLAALTLVKSQRSVLIVRYESATDTSVGFIERVHPREWKATWTSDDFDC
jgi:hypothetical protein